MSEYINIDHIDQLLAMPLERQQKFREAIQSYLKEHPITHIATDWGRFEGIGPLNTEEVEMLIEAILKEMTLEQKVNQMSAD